MKEKIKYFALENAIKFNGKANPGAIVGKILALDPELKKEMGTLCKEIAMTVKDVNSLSLDDQKKEFESFDKIDKPKREERKGLPDLPDAVQGKVVTRIPPEPSKYNHIGHALSFLINYMYAVKYEGKCLLKFEDTNPEKVTQEFADAMEEAAALGVVAFIQPGGSVRDEEVIKRADELGVSMLFSGRRYFRH